MHSDLQHFLSQLRHIQEDVKRHSLDPLMGHSRVQFGRIEERLARTLGELDYLVNLKMTMKRDS